MDIISNFSQYLLVAVLVINAALIFLVLRNNFKSATSIIFAFLSLVTSAWLAVISKTMAPLSTDLLWYTRFTVFLAVPQSVLFFILSHTIPSEKLLLKKNSFFAIIFGMLFVMALTLSPYVFNRVEVFGDVISSIPGPAMPIFAIFTSFFSIGAIYVLFKKIRNSSGQEKSQLLIVITGILLMLGLIIGTILIPVALFQNQMFIPFSPLYALIFFGATAYAIVKYQLFNLKVIATEALIWILWIILFSKVIVSESISAGIVDFFVFTLLVFFGVLLIRSMRKEVHQREELERLNKELEKVNAKLNELNRFKTQLLSLASHQIKSPLAAIKGFVSLISDGLYGPITDKTKEALVKVKDSADGLINLINTLLDLRKAEEGRFDFKFEKTDISILVKEVVMMFQPLASAKKLSLTFSLPDSETFLNVDGQKLKQVFQNIVDNAIKYTPQGFVKVELKKDGRNLIFSVTDSGLGIPSDLLPSLFEEFVRDERVKSKILGTGLGLYIARKIIEAHGGKISAKSEGENKGSKFSVYLPLTPEHHG